MKNTLNPTAIKRLSFYVASPVETCDRCSAGIKHVALIEYKDGTRYRYGSECINKILAGDNSLKSLYAKNAKLLKKYLEWAEILARPVDQIPRGNEYYDSGIFFCVDSKGENIRKSSSSSIFHPIVDLEKNIAGGRYVADGCLPCMSN